MRRLCPACRDDRFPLNGIANGHGNFPTAAEPHVSEAHGEVFSWNTSIRAKAGAVPRKIWWHCDYDMEMKQDAHIPSVDVGLSSTAKTMSVHRFQLDRIGQDLRCQDVWRIAPQQYREPPSTSRLD
jgi:hypothetical protein